MEHDGAMNDRRQSQARALVIMGLSVNVLAALVDLVNIYGSGIYKLLRFSGCFSGFLSVFITLSVAGAWWFLAKMSVESSEQRSLLGKALYWFALESLLGVVDFVNDGWHQSITTWTGSIVWIMVIGGVIETIGLVLLARVFTTITFENRESQELSIE
jgi:hypothetical protein